MATVVSLLTNGLPIYDIRRMLVRTDKILWKTVGQNTAISWEKQLDHKLHALVSVYTLHYLSKGINTDHLMMKAYLNRSSFH